MDEVVQKIEWWGKDRFDGRFIEVRTETSSTRIEIPDSEPPVCDVCNDSIEEFPCCVLSGHALCPSCREKHGISSGDTEYFESMEYRVGDEDPNPGVNFGGRKTP